MSQVTLDDASLYDIGDSIRAKLGVSTQYKPSQMAGAINSIPTGSTPALGTKSITQNGTYAASGDNLDGYSSVEVNVSGGSATLIAKNISQNGSYAASGDSADGYSSVSVNVPNSYTAGDEGKIVQNGALATQTARASEITANGTYDTTNNNSVMVNVSGGDSPSLGTKTINENGTYAASGDNLDGYSSVTVSVSSWLSFDSEATAGLL